MNSDEAFEQVKRGFDAGRLAHGYIIAGPVREAGMPLVDRLLGLFFCEAEERPCGTCRGCLQAAEHTHADLAWLSPEKKSRIISIDQIRSMENMMYMTSYAGGWKVCVITAADRMRDAAANAFLKLLEEPPEKTLFFLLTNNPQFLLPTIVSRCQRISISGESRYREADWKAGVVNILSDVGSSGPAGAFALTDRMLEILQDIRKQVEAKEKELFREDTLDESKDVLEARISARYREIRTNIMAFMTLWFRDIFLLVNSGDEDCLCCFDEADLIRSKAGMLDYSSARSNIEVVDEMNGQLESNIPDRAVLNYGFSRLC